MQSAVMSHQGDKSPPTPIATATVATPANTQRVDGGCLQALSHRGTSKSFRSCGLDVGREEACSLALSGVFPTEIRIEPGTLAEMVRDIVPARKKRITTCYTFQTGETGEEGRLRYRAQCFSSPLSRASERQQEQKIEQTTQREPTCHPRAQNTSVLKRVPVHNKAEVDPARSTQRTRCNAMQRNATQFNAAGTHCFGGPPLPPPLPSPARIVVRVLEIDQPERGDGFLAPRADQHIPCQDKKQNTKKRIDRTHGCTRNV